MRLLEVLPIVHYEIHSSFLKPLQYFVAVPLWLNTSTMQAEIQLQAGKRWWSQEGGHYITNHPNNATNHNGNHSKLQSIYLQHFVDPPPKMGECPLFYSQEDPVFRLLPRQTNIKLLNKSLLTSCGVKALPLPQSPGTVQTRSWNVPDGQRGRQLNRLMSKRWPWKTRKTSVKKHGEW